MELLPDLGTALLLLLLGLFTLNCCDAESVTSRIRHFSGSARQDYEWGTTPISDPFPVTPESVCIKARPEASRATDSYAALSLEMPAEPFWSKRVRFRALVGRRRVPAGSSGYAALFVRVQAADGTTLVMDNMWNRPIKGYAYVHDWQEVVLDVPGPPLYSCPLDGWGLPAVIQLGFLLAGGRGDVYLGQANFGVVSKRESPAVTGRPGPWLGPPTLPY